MPVGFHVQGVPALGSHIKKVATEAPKLDATVVNKLALEAKKTIVATAVPKRLSRMGKKGATLSAGFKPATGKPASATIFPRPPGAWYLLEGGGGPHDIGNKRGGKRGHVGFLGRPGIFAATGPVHHPGVAAKHTWSHASAAGEARAAAQFRSTQTKAYVALFT